MSTTPIEQMLDEIDYVKIDSKPSENGLSYATHEGILKIGEFSLKVYVLNDGRRIIEVKDLEEFFK